MPRCVFESLMQWADLLSLLAPHWAALRFVVPLPTCSSLEPSACLSVWTHWPGKKFFFYPLQTLERQCLTVLSVWLALPSLLTLRRWSLLHSGTISNGLKEDFMLALIHLDGLDTIICWFMLVRWRLQHLSIISSSRSRVESVLHHINFLLLNGFKIHFLNVKLIFFKMNDIDDSSCTTQILSNEMFSRMRMSHPLKPSGTNSKK